MNQQELLKIVGAMLMRSGGKFTITEEAIVRMDDCGVEAWYDPVRREYIVELVGDYRPAVGQGPFQSWEIIPEQETVQGVIEP